MPEYQEAFLQCLLRCISLWLLRNIFYVDNCYCASQQQHSTDSDSEWKRDSPHNDVSYCSEEMHKIKYYQLSYGISGSALYLVG